MKTETGFERMVARLSAGFAELSGEQASVLKKHYELMLKWNKAINLTRITEAGEAAERHYGESLYLASRLGAGVKSVVDYGSGAGFPGYPVAVWRGDVKVTLVEADQRKAAFLREASDWVGNVVVKAVRAEELAGPYDVLISRAVKPVEVVKVAQRIAKGVALLISEEDAAGLKFEGARVEKLPFGRGGVLYMADFG